ncbi:hypothetical protein [Staphylococcus americanisciuri]|uniref:Phage protein n=1 Tax=Staphylococcus americanisciuri TaxID=2973940 RepID=A0ABT2F103_9STAP|nr:hypothetical protein [Staphylococcus americanisciuri]MCS4485535.1 hypothetical protein [Staphylococcus americanisciuri]
MLTIKFEDQTKYIQENKEVALKVTQAIFKDFELGKRKFDKPRKNPDKARLLVEFEERFNSRRKETIKSN